MMSDYNIFQLLFQDMSQKVCLDCNNPFSQKCQQMTYCQVHKGKCFSCKDCSKQRTSTENYIECSQCSRLVSSDEAFYDVHCGSFLCKYEFLQTDYSDMHVLLRCGHYEEKQQVLLFMGENCIKCCRKIEKDNINCYFCSKEAFPSYEQKPNKKYQSESYETIISCLNEDLIDMRLCNNLQRNSIIKLKKVVEREDNECDLCKEPFNLDGKRPMMLCHNQHNCCQKCLSSDIIKEECPFCRVKIDKKEVVSARDRIKLLQVYQHLYIDFAQKVKGLQEEPDEIRKKPDAIPLKPDAIQKKPDVTVLKPLIKIDTKMVKREEIKAINKKLAVRAVPVKTKTIVKKKK